MSMEKSLIRPVSTGNIIMGKRQSVRFKAFVFTTLFSRTKAVNTTDILLHLLLLLFLHHVFIVVLLLLNVEYNENHW